ncbi:hypothetical protein GCM10009626_18990 [Brachybacterium sacelli]
MFGAYSPVLQTRRVRPRLVAMFLSAVPLGMLSLTIVLSVQEWTGTLSTAGSISALFGAGNAIGLSVQGPLMDRVGSRRVVIAAGGTCTASLLGFGVAGAFGGPLWVVAVMAGVAGVSVPAITTAVRAWLSHAFVDDTLRGTSYALLSALFQGAVTIGPVLVSLSLLLHGPEIAVGLGALMILSATIVFALVSDRQAPPAVIRPFVAPDARVVRSPGLWTIFGAAALEGLAVGVTAVAIPGVMTEAGIAAVAGVAFAALALGEVIGALAFGARTWPGRRSAQLPIVQAAVAVVAVLVHFASAQPWLLVLVMVGAGVIGAPGSILRSTMLDDVAPASAIARSFALLVAIGLVSGAAGNALAGQLVSHTGVRDLLLIPPIFIGLAAALVTTRRSTLEAGQTALQRDPG